GAMRRSLPGIVLAVVGMLAGCGASSTPAAKPPPAASAPAPAQPAAPPPGPLTTVTVGQVAAVLYPFYIGIERGYFTEQGIEVQYDTFRGGAEIDRKSVV